MYLQISSVTGDIRSDKTPENDHECLFLSVGSLLLTSCSNWKDLHVGKPDPFKGFSLHLSYGSLQFSIKGPRF